MTASRLLVPALWYAGILALSSLPAATFEPIPWVSGLSYLAHAVLYGVLGAALWWALRPLPRVVIVVAVVGLCLGAADEWLQSTVPGRDASLLDLLVDITAATLAATVLRRRAPS